VQRKNDESHHTERYPTQDLIEWIKKIRTRTTRKMGKLDYNNERVQISSQNEHKHQNDDQTRVFQPGMPLLRSKSGHRSHPMAL
jgi:hypothetical protein